ncbi:MAG TPA: zf-HC2 domain-containing protein [Leptolinea sp.]
MKCRQISKKLSAYLDQELTTGVAKQVEEHLITCEFCRLDLAELRRTRQTAAAALYEMAASAEPSAQAWSSLQSRLKVGQISHKKKEQSWLSRLAPGWKVDINVGLLGEFVMKQKIAVLLSGVLIFGILGFFLTYKNVTPVSAKQILEKAYEVQKAANLATGISHIKVERYSNYEAKEGKDAGITSILENYTDYQTGNYRLVEYFSPEMKVRHVDGYDGKFTYSSDYLDRTRKDETLVVYRSPQSREKLSVLDDMGPIFSAEETFEAMRMDPKITLESMMSSSDGKKAYVLVAVHTMDKQYFNINGKVSVLEGGTSRERMVFDASTYELLETETTVKKDGNEIITNSLVFLTREALPKDARVIWDMTDLKGIKLEDDLDWTKGDLIPEKITEKELASQTSTAYLLENVPQGFELTITANPNQKKNPYYLYVARYQNAAGDYFNIQSTENEPISQYKDEAQEVFDLKDGMKAFIYNKANDSLTGDVYQMARVKVSENATILINSTLSLEKVKSLLDGLVKVK